MTTPGSLNHYLEFSGSFVHSLIDAIRRADEKNRNRLKLAFPQVVAALEMNSWDEAPPDYPPQYNAIEGDPDRERWVEVAVATYHRDGEQAIDFDAEPAVSVSEEGAYVAARVWVPREEVEEEVAIDKDSEGVVKNPTGWRPYPTEQVDRPART